MTDSRNEQTTVIAPGTAISGDMTFSGPTSVLGRLDGTITSSDCIEIGRDATVAAEVTAENVLVDGAIEGNVTARDKLQLNSTAKLQGDVNARTLIVSEGASFVGHCKVGAESGAARSTPPTGSTKRQQTAVSQPPTPLSETKPLMDEDDELAVTAAQLQQAS